MAVAGARRVALVLITPELVVQLARLRPGERVEIVDSAVPVDARVISVDYDSQRACFGVVLEHESFAHVELGDRLPILEPATISIICDEERP